MSNLPEKMRYADTLSASDLLPQAYRRKPSNVLVAMEYGESLGFSPLQAMTLVHVIDSKPTLSAQAIGGLVRKAGHTLRVRIEGEGQRARATAEIIRRDDPDFTFTSVWTWEKAQAAGLVNKQVWKNYPESMLKARAITQAARDACPEVMFGAAYTAEELGADDVDEYGGAARPTVTTQGTDEEPIVARTAKDAFLEACGLNEVDPAEVYAIVGHDDVNADPQPFRDAFKAILAGRDAPDSTPPASPAAGDEEPAPDEGVNDAAATLEGSSPAGSLLDDTEMVPVAPSDDVTVSLSKEQRVALMAEASRVFGKDKDGRLKWAGQVTGRLVTSFNELTSWEADWMLARMRQVAS